MPPMTLPMHSSSRAGEVILCFISCAAAELTPNGLRISCAIPPMIMPSAASFSPWCICASMARCSTRLRPTTTTPVTSPRSSVIRDRRQDTGMLSPLRHRIGHSTEWRSSISAMPLKQASTSRLCGSSIWSASLAAAHFDMAVAGGFLRRRVPGHDGSRRVGGDDEVSGALDDAGEMQLHPAHFLAEPQQVGHIVHDQDRPARAAVELQRTNAVGIDPQRDAGRAIGHPLAVQGPAGDDDVADLLVERSILKRGGKDFVQPPAQCRTQAAVGFLQEIVIDRQDGETFVEDQDRRGDRRHDGLKEAFVVERGEEHLGACPRNDNVR